MRCQGRRSPTRARHAKGGEALAEAFAQTFVWGLVLLTLALIPALTMALGKSRVPAREPTAAEEPAIVSG